MFVYFYRLDFCLFDFQSGDVSGQKDFTFAFTSGEMVCAVDKYVIVFPDFGASVFADFDV